MGSLLLFVKIFGTSFTGVYVIEWTQGEWTLTPLVHTPRRQEDPWYLTR